MSARSHPASPTVSVMMPAFNAESYIALAIESLIAQSFADWELIVVDDGSTDATGEIADRWGADPRVRVVHQQNAGEGAARNTALDMLRGRYLAFLDADDLYLPQHLTTTVRTLEAHPVAVGVYSDGYHIDGAGHQLTPLSTRRRGPFSGDIFTEVIRGSDLVCPPVSVALRVDMILRHGLRFDEDLRVGTDWVFLARLASLGPFEHLDEPTCQYRVHSGSVTMNADLRARSRELAKCRLRMTEIPGFAECPVDVRAAALYELLVNLLRSVPEQQAVIVDSQPFQALPPAQQARILRLMASKAILHGEAPAAVKTWLARNRELGVRDVKGEIISTLYRISPTVCRLVLRIRTRDEVDPLTVPPFADLAVPGL